MAAPSTLRRDWIERIFSRLHGIYGSQFSGKYHQGVMVNGVDAGLENAMQVWAEELAGFDDHGEAIKYALDNLDPKFPPSSKEFLNLCRRAPKKQAPMVEHKVSPEELARGLEKLNSVQQSVKKPKYDPIGWARQPAGQYAITALLELAEKGEDRFVEVLEDLRQQGIVKGSTLVRRWDHVSRSWVAA